MTQPLTPRRAGVVITRSMKTLRFIAALVPVLLLAVGKPAAAEKVYKWVDEDGVVHYGHALPPSEAGRAHKVLNEQGIAVEDVATAKTAEQIAEEARLAAAAKEAAKRDQVLLNTYLSVDEIENLRDRRVELLEAQNRVTQKYLDGLEDKLSGLQAEAAGHEARAESAGEAVAIPADLSAEISHAERGIEGYRREIETRRVDQERIRAQFDADIARFQGTQGLAARGLNPVAALPDCRQDRPELPNPPAPRSLSSKDSTTSKRTCTTGRITIWAIRSPGSMVKGAFPRFQHEINTWPW